MKRIVFPAVCLLLMASVSLAQNGMSSVYYPMKTGSKWTYRVGDQPMELKVTGYDDVDGAKCAVLETRVNNQVFTEHVAVGKDGLYRYKVRTDGVDQKIEPPLRFFKLPPENTSWEVDSKVGNFGNLRAKGVCRMSEADVAVPAGKFKTYVSRFDIKQGDQTVTINIYLAPNVGMVKQVMSVAGKEVTIELEKYEEAK